MKDKVYLIDLGTGTTRNLIPLAAGLLASTAQSIPGVAAKYSFDIRMLEESIEDLVAEIDRPSVIGFSCYCWNALGTVQAAKLCKERFPDALIVFGGYSVPSYPDRIEKFFNDYPFVDVLIHGEGEITFAELLQADIASRDFSGIKGLSYRVPGLKRAEFIRTPKRDRIEDFGVIPSPYLNGIFDEVFDRYKSTLYGALWESNRGCPFGCTFCAWGDPTVNKVSKLNMERLLKELDWISSKRLDYIYNTDANFGIYFERDMELAKHLVALTKQNGAPTQFVTNWTKNSHSNIVELANVFKSGGVNINVTLSLQSLNVKVLDAIKRRNIRFEELTDLKRYFHGKHLPTYTEFILPLPEETYETFIDGLNRTLTPYLEDQLAVYICTILENTEMSRLEYMEKYRLETRTCSVGLNRRIFKYDRFGEEIIVVGTSTMSNAEWQKAYILAFALMSFYNLRSLFFLMIYLMKEFKVKALDYIEFLYNQTKNNPGKYPAFDAAFAHLELQRKKILDGISSVSAVEGSNGVNFTPHEAVLFLVLDRMGTFYEEVGTLTRQFLKHAKISYNEEILEEVLMYQKMRMPVWKPKKTVYDFKYTVFDYFEALCQGIEPQTIAVVSNEVELEVPPQVYDNELEFNRRRVARGYSVQIFNCHQKKQHVRV